VVEELSGINRINSKLIYDSLAFTNTLLDAIKDGEREKGIYEQKGEKKEERRPILVDRRA
jgi:hypothetical protein